MRKKPAAASAKPSTRNSRSCKKKEDQEEKVELDATLTFSSREVLQHADFETMTADELAQSKALIKRMRLPIRDIRTRRFRADLHGARIDMRATMRASLREGGGLIDIKRCDWGWTLLGAGGAEIGRETEDTRAPEVDGILRQHINVLQVVATVRWKREHAGSNIGSARGREWR